jgi:hypothetical protein
LTDETTECAFGWPALAIWARQRPGSACTFGPLPWRWDGPDVTVAAAVCGAAAFDPALSDDASVGLSLEWVGATELGAPPPIETAAAAVAVPAPTMRTTAITIALAGRAFENILLLLTVRMVSGSKLDKQRAARQPMPDDSLSSEARKTRTDLGRHRLLYPHFDRTFPRMP